MRLSKLDIQWFYSASYGYFIFSVLFKCFVSSDEVLFTSGKSFSAANYTHIVTHDFVLGNLHYIQGHYKTRRSFLQIRIFE